MAEHDHEHHDHDHDHAHPPAKGAEPSVAGNTDPAQQSLADALQVSFFLLKAIMILLVVFYVFSGIYQVPENEVAIVTRFGKIVGDDSQGVEAVRGPGLYFGLPFPIDDRIEVPTSPRTIDLTQAFMYNTPERELTLSADERTGGPLNPEKDGSLITGDANIVHARFNTTYFIEDPVDYVKNVGDLDKADALVQSVVEHGIVYAAATVSADDFIGGRFAPERATGKAQSVLDTADTGLKITNIRISDPEMPLSVRAAYSAVSQSDARRSTLVNEARKDQTRLLGEAAGKAALPSNNQNGPLVDLIKQYELATANNDEQELARLDGELRIAFRSLSMTRDDVVYDLGGEAARIINEALIKKTQQVEQIKSEAQTVAKLKPAYDRDPELFKDLMWQAAAREIFTPESDIELWYAMPNGELYLQMNRDPQITRDRETIRLQTQREENAK